VLELPHNDPDAHIVRGIIDLVHGLGKHVVAEGVVYERMRSLTTCSPPRLTWIVECGTLMSEAATSVARESDRAVEAPAP
jgi:hypothetical protein